MKPHVLDSNNGQVVSGFESCSLESLVLASLNQLMPDNDSIEKGYLQRYTQIDLSVTGIEQALQDAGGTDSNLRAVSQRHQLSLEEIVMLQLCLLVERDPMVGRCLAVLQNPLGGSRPTLGLLEKCLTCFGFGTPWLASRILGGAALSHQLIQLGNTDAPLPEQTVAVPLASLWALIGSAAAQTNIGLTPIQENTQLLTRRVLDDAIGYAHALNADKRVLLKIVAGFEEESLAAAQMVAYTLGRQALLCRDITSLPPGAGCFISACSGIPVVVLAKAAGDVAKINEIPGYQGPLIAVSNDDFPLQASGRTLVNWRMPMPTLAERQQLWQHFIEEPAHTRQLAAKYIHSGSRICQLAAVARSQAARECRTIQTSDVIQAARRGENAGLGSLVHAVAGEVGDEGLVLEDSTRKRLNTLYLRCSSRESLHHAMGVSITQKYQPGVKALMVGPSGTGKTLSASWLATRLGLPLYRVDVASVVSKYIGETEKNLSELLSRAESSDVILLFDEADSLFGKRTDVKDSSDRFANSQTNYLLQRIENYRGIVLLTSNSRSRIDSAFLRRLDHIVEFPLPNAEQRRALWRVHLGDNHTLSGRLLNKLSAKCDFSGGHIRNSVLTAAVLARHEERPIDYTDIIEGVDAEYRKLGKQLPMGLQA